MMSGETVTVRIENLRRGGVWDIVPPRSLRENLEYRRTIRLWALQKRAHREALLERCAVDFMFWCETFAWIFEPRPEKDRPQVIPFLPWTHQIPIIKDIIDNIGYRDIGIEKARGEGATWLCLMIILWMWLFRDMNAFGLVSRHEMAADNPDDPDSLGWKIDWQLGMLPLWMGGKKGDDYIRNISKHTWVNKRNGSTITAYPATGDLASGGRKTCFFMDELAKFPRGPDEEAMSATEPVTNSRLLVSTYDGADGAYYRCMTSESSMLKMILDWTRNPTRNQDMFRIDMQNRKLLSVKNDGQEMPIEMQEKFFKEDYPILAKRGFDVDSKTKVWSLWYVSRCVRPGMTPKKIAQEYDRDPGGTSSRFFPAGTIEMLCERARPATIQGDIIIDMEKLVVRTFTKLKEGRLKLWIPLVGGMRPPSGDYVMGIDIATGQGGTMSSNSVISIANRKTGSKVAEYADPNTKPERLAEIGVALARWFLNGTGGEAYMVWEGNGSGGSFRNHIIQETTFRNFYYRTNPKTPGAKPTKEPGWWSGKEQKRELLSRYRHALIEGFFDNPNEMALRETLCYVEDTGGKVKFKSGSNDEIDPANDGENHGDRVIADALANMGMEELNGSQDTLKMKSTPTIGPPKGSFAYRRLVDQHKKKKASTDW